MLKIQILFVTCMAACVAEDVAEGELAALDRTEQQVIGGVTATPGEFPWQAQLRVPGYAHWCGGSLVNERWVLTAAHCVDSYVGAPASVTVTLGEHDRAVSEGTEQVRTARQIVVHPHWRPAQLQNDIALIELSTPVTLNSRVQPIRLEPGLRPLGTSAVVTGWGNTSPGSGASSVLMEASLPLTANGTCDADPRLPDYRVTDSMICAGFSLGARGGCHGDSGGPLVASTPTGPQLQGIVSWGRGGTCDSYTIFTRVGHFTSWIHGVMFATPRTCAGQTAPGHTAWQPYSADTLYLDVDTSACGYTTTPRYFPSLGGNTNHWRTTGATSVYAATPTGFRIYVFDKYGPVTPGDAASRGWHVSWEALPGLVYRPEVCTGGTTSGATAWQQYGTRGLYLDVDTSACGFTSTPRYFTSIGGNTNHWRTTGATAIYSPTATGFRIFLYDEIGEITPGDANAYGWRINWQARPSGTTTDACTGVQSTGWQVYNAQALYMSVNTSACGFTSTPSSYVTSLGGTLNNWRATGPNSIYSPTPTGFTIYVYDETGPLTPADATARSWHLNWHARR